MTVTSNNKPRTITGKDIFLAAVLGVLVCLIGTWQMVPGVCGTFDDDALYLSSAKALAQGEGYRLPNLPGTPPQTKYPPVYPALLAAIWSLWPDFPGNLVAFQALSLFFAGLSLAFGYLYLLRSSYAGRGTAFFCGLLCASSHFYLYYTSQILSETVWAFLLIVALLCSESPGEKDHYPQRREISLGILLGLLCLTRIAGLAVLIGFIIYFLWTRRNPLRLLLGWLVCFAPWIVWSAVNRTSTHSVGAHSYYTGYLDWWLEAVSHYHRVLIANFAEIFFFTPLTIFEGLWNHPLLPESSALVFLAFTLGILLWIGFIESLRSKRILPFILLVYLTLGCMWPGPPSRLLVPVLMLLLTCQIQPFIRNRTRSLGTRLLHPVFLGVLSLAMVTNIFLLFSYSALHKRTGLPWIEFPRSEEIHWSAYQDIFSWVREHTSVKETIAGTGDGMLYLYTGRKTIRPYTLKPLRAHYGSGPAYGTPEEMLAVLKTSSIRYLVVLRLPADSDQHKFYSLLDEFRKRYGTHLKVAYAHKEPSFFVLEISPSLYNISADRYTEREDSRTKQRELP